MLSPCLLQLLSVPVKSSPGAHLQGLTHVAGGYTLTGMAVHWDARQRKLTPRL